MFHIISLFAAELEDPKIGISGKGLKYIWKQSIVCILLIWVISRSSIIKLFQHMFHKMSKDCLVKVSVYGKALNIQSVHGQIYKY